MAVASIDYRNVPATGAVGIFASCWDWDAAASIAVDMDTSTHPELPASDWLRVISVDAATGTESTIAHFRRADGLHARLALEPRTVAHWRIESADIAQVAPTLQFSSASSSSTPASSSGSKSIGPLPPR